MGVPQVVGGEGDGEGHPEGGPGARNAAEGNGAAVVLHDLMRKGEAEARAGSFGREEGVENLVRLGRGDTLARVLDLDLDLAAGSRRSGEPRGAGTVIPA